MALDCGIEIECLFPAQAAGFDSRALVNRVASGIAQDIIDAGVPCSFVGYNHHRSESWKIVTDMSIQAPTGFVGLELVSPVLGEATLAQIETVCNVITRLGARTNRTCGLHVHIGARHLSIDTLRRLAYLYIEHEEVIDSLLPPSRRANNNNFCRSLKTNVIMDRLRTAPTVEEISKAIARNGAGRWEEPSRYVKLNFTSYWRHGTVEFRQHSGTIDSAKITKWIYLCQKMVDIAGMETATVMAPPVTNSELAAKLAKIKVAAVIYNLACRPEGVTPGEAREALAWKNMPNPAIDLTRLGIAWVQEGRRGRQKVFKVLNTAAPATLSSLLDKLGCDEEEKRFWIERRALLGTIGISADLAE
jgi:Putative amidoligase enzyme